MTPSPQENMAEQQPEAIPRGLTGEELVITGISGLFPKSNNVLEFMENLYNKVDMVSDDYVRWDIDHTEIPKHYGNINGVNEFDAQFFKVHYKQAKIMDPMSRKLLEETYSAIFDAGINPLELRGKKIGVFIGAAFSEFEKIAIYDSMQRNGFGVTGGNKAMYANRISYWLDSKGPSYTIDVTCSSSMACLEHAYKSITSGICEAAIVGGCNLCLHPNVALNMRRYGFLCMDGKTKCFDKHGDGAVRADAVNVIFLQKAKDAKRIYSEVYRAKTNYTNTTRDQFLPIRDPKEIQEFLEDFYLEIGISPSVVEYVEASASAIAEADGNELEAIGKVFAKDKPILVGSVKSNMGHSEPASGVCSLTKVCIAYHQGKIPGNLHYNEPQDHIPLVREGKVQVVTENTPFGRGYSALNNLSYSGANFHVLLKGHYKPKNIDRYRSSIPHIVLASSRQDECMKNMIKKINSSPVDPEQIGLIHDIHKIEIPGHTCRGYTIIETNDKNETVCLAQDVEYIDGATAPVWFVYSGMGSQWASMGTDLMRFPIFAAAVEKCHRVLEPKGIDIINILTNPDKTIYDNILHSFVGIAAVQIGLTDILREMGIVPDNIIGHSVGELGCAYADGCLTAEEMILSAYSRGLVSVQTPFIRGSMAAVGLGYKAVKSLCPPEIEVACHNSSDSSTISGPADKMKDFVAELTSRSIFAKEVPCSNIAYHSRYIRDAGPSLLKYLSDVIKNPKRRSEKWVSTSVPQSQWNEPAAQYSSAEYHTNNLLREVLFEETSQLIPANAIVIEIAPHGLLQAILKRSLTACTHVPLTRRGHSNPVKFMLEAVGKLYLAGLNPRVSVLYPKIEYPVSTETPLLSHLVGWEHSEIWPEAKYQARERVLSANRDYFISIHDDDYKYFENYMRDGAVILPEAALLVIIWETLAMSKGVDYRTMSVEFNNVHFHEEIVIKPDDPLKMTVEIQKGRQYFEINQDLTVVANGFINIIKPKNSEERHLIKSNKKYLDDIVFSTDDIYKILRMKGYLYQGEFRSIHSITSNCTSANIKFTDKWIILLDSLLQFHIFGREHAGFTALKHIDKLSIDVEQHDKAHHQVVDDVKCFRAEFFDIHNITKCGGIEFGMVNYIDKPIIETEPEVLHTLNFVPHVLPDKIDLKSALHVNLQIVSENTIKSQIKVMNLLSSEYPTIFEVLKEVTDEIVTKEFILTGSSKNDAKDTPTLFVIDNLLEDDHKIKTLSRALTRFEFILAFEKESSKVYQEHNSLNVITTMMVVKDHIKLVLLNKIDSSNTGNVTYLPVVSEDKFSWVPKVRMEIATAKELVLITEHKYSTGFIGVVKALRKQYGDKIRLLIVDDYCVIRSDRESQMFKEHLLKRLAINVLKEDRWGGYYYIPKPKDINVGNVTLTSGSPGDLDCLKWVELPAMPASNTLVQVCYVGLSSEDAYNAVGTSLKISKGFGKEFSGINKNGDRVMGIIPESALSSMVEADPALLWLVPEHWSLEDAATVPLAYLHAYYCLTITFKCKSLERAPIFVNGATEPFGQAIIALALHMGCLVYASVEDMQKKELLLKMFPQLDEKNIGCSEIDSAHYMVVINSKNKGCALSINCLSGALRESAMKCVGLGGCILDISDIDRNESKDFGMGFLFEERSYKNVSISSLFRPEYAHEKKLMQYTIAEGIAKGIVRPLNRLVYSPLDLTRAFRLLSSKKYGGKVVIRMTDIQTRPLDLNFTPRVRYSSEGTFIIVCDENLLGIVVADRLVQQGVKKLVVHLKSNNLSGYFYNKLMSWSKLNATVKISSENLLTDIGCINLIKEGTDMATVLGIFVIQNYESEATDEGLGVENMTKIFNKAVPVVANLDGASRNLCSKLEHFVVLNYSSKTISDKYAVSAIEKICEARNEVHLPALVIRINSINEFDTYVHDETRTRPQKISTVLNALETSLKLKCNNVVSYDLKKIRNYDFLEKLGKIIGSLKNLSSIVKRANTRFDAGLGAFYTYTDEDECMATEPMIQMPTKLSNAPKEDRELDPRDTYLILIPGFEGHHQIFTRVTERLKVNAMTFQLGPDMTEDSIEKMAQNILKSAMKCVGLGGCILDISDIDRNESKDFGMGFLFEERSYKNVSISSLFRPEYAHEKKLMQYTIAEGIAKGIVRPLNRLVYSPLDLTRAFRLLSSKKYGGKVVIRMTDIQTRPLDLNFTPRVRYSSEGTFIIVCDENLLGIVVADRLVQQGVKKLVVHLKSNNLSGYFYNKLMSWSKLNATVKISSENLLTDIGCINLIKEGTDMATVLGIFVIQNYESEATDEGLGVENMTKIFNKAVPVVANLDGASRNLCSKLEHFVVLNYSSKTISDKYAVSAIEKICEARNEVHLPALVIRINSINEFDTYVHDETRTRPQKISTVLNALETSLKLKCNNVVSYDLKKIRNYDFLEKLGKIIGMKHVASIEEKLTLTSLSVNDISLQEIKHLIKQVYDISFSTDKLVQMDIASLKNLSSIVKRANTRFDAGLGAFYTYTDEDECMATEPMIQMPTKLSNAPKEDRELDPRDTYLILIPGFEGHHQIFTRVTERLKVNAMTFQLGPDMTEDSIEKMAQNILKFMKKRFELKSTFYLLGYSFGVNVALEVAALLEKEGRVGTVFCLDSSPDALRVQLDAYIGSLSDTELQNSIVEHLYRLMTGRDSEDLKKDLGRFESWPEKVEACVNRLRGIVSYSNQYKRSILKAAYRRIMLARQYEPNFKLESQLVLMRGIPHPKAETTTEDYNLTKYTTKPVKVFHIDSDHASAPYDCRVSNIVNNFLDPELLSEFEKRGLCDSYLADAFKMI